MSWSTIEAEAVHAFVGEGRFPFPAYSDFMPPPYVGLKPVDPRREGANCTSAAGDDGSLDISEYEQTLELAPGLAHLAARICAELGKLAGGGTGDLSHALLDGNPALAPLHADQPLVLLLSLALSRTQDDKGNVRWTLFGVSHEGAAPAFTRSVHEPDELARIAAWAGGAGGVRVIGDELAHVGRAFDGSLDGVRTIVTFRPYASLPPAVREAHARGALHLIPTPSSLCFFEHPGYRALARTLPRATQIPLLHLFQRVEGGYSLRIPQSGWLDEHDGGATRGHRLVQKVIRTHRWQRTSKHEALTGEGAYEDAVSVALFSSKPEDLGLYGKPMARNAQVWREDYRLLLDGPRATPLEIERAAATVDVGGRFGYRFVFPPMRAGRRELFWHLPLCARLDPGADAPVLLERAPLGYVTAEPQPEEAYLPRIELAPRLLARPGHVEAARHFNHDPGRPRFTTAHNIRKLLEAHEYLGGPIAPSFARALVHCAKDLELEEWLGKLGEHSDDAAAAKRVHALLKKTLGAPVDPGEPRTFGHTANRDFEETVWRTIASLAEGEFRWKENADGIPANKGKTGGPRGKAAHVEASTAKRDLERLGDHLHDRYRALIAKHGMTGRAEVVDHCFRWDTDFDFSWSEGWKHNRLRTGHERNIVLMIPGRERGEAVVMGDHYDTAYMEDVHDSDTGGDGLRAAAAGADDNHSATTALLCAADVLLPMARDGLLARDVWLVHLTGEEFPTDCLGARMLCQALVERRLRFTGEDGAIVDVSGTRVVGAFVLDMVAHNTERDRDCFQISPGEGPGSMRLALRAHLANAKWNARVPAWNHARPGLGRAERREGAEPPPPFAHLAIRGEVRTEWGPRSSLFNTDGQVFSDVGIPVVLFMENYDISRSGYHDTNDTMKNIDLDYGAALLAIAIETVADTACADEV